MSVLIKFNPSIMIFFSLYFTIPINKDEMKYMRNITEKNKFQIS